MFILLIIVEGMITFRTLSNATRIVFEQFPTIAQWRKDLNIYQSRMFFCSSVFVFCLLLANKRVNIVYFPLLVWS